MVVSIIAAVDEQYAIGKNQQLLCHLPNDMKHFKEITTEHTVIMGRKTFESLPGGALPNRRNLVISAGTGVRFENAVQYGSLQEALKACENEDEVFIIGGGSIYRQALPLADKIYLTLIRHTFEGSDTFFLPIDTAKWIETTRRDFVKDEKHPYSYSFFTYLRKK
ncbi:MAG: dihydrofolate reductase [Tannerella sp.]|jgi:dihydrofolate reductase|nr:dihydrofolate reductase [Tannerella sp.]